ncbi:MAG TPA: BadF/BadG/BcrA/BcrD ATPase family protein [Noviherbaspirillum sp.]
MAETRYFLGIDGGGTGCRARLTDRSGRILGEGSAGPANLALGIDVAVASTMSATRQALATAGLADEDLALTDVGLGMAAANVPRHKEALEKVALPFRSFVVLSDAETACLGAHAGADGGLLILGTGSQGVICRNGVFTTVGGWGFAISDSGSGAILGRAAVRRAFLAHEGVEPPSALTEEIMKRFDANPSAMLEWAESAKPRDWGEFARIVFRHVEAGDPVSLELVRDNASAVERMLDRMVALGAGRVALMGGLAKPTRPYLSSRFDAVIVEAQGDALDGALLLARRHAAKEENDATPT